MPNFKSISFKMAVLQGGGQNLPSPCVCHSKDPMWNRVNKPLKMIENDKLRFKQMDECHICGDRYTDKDVHVRDHCHFIENSGAQLVKNVT